MSDRLDPPSGLRPSRPPAELRARVLTAAAEASMRPRLGIIETLAADRTLRWLAAAILVLTILNVAAGAAGRVGPRSLSPSARSILSGDEDQPEIQVELTASEQAPRVAAVLDGTGG